MPRRKTDFTDIIYLTDRIRSQMKMVLNYPCTLVEAPMGYGKTTAVRGCLKMEKVRVLWQKIMDSSVSGFWSSFCRQFREFDDAGAERLKQMGMPGESTSMELAQELIQSMLPAEKTVLVLDDYHLVDCPEVNRFIEYLLFNELPDFHIVLTARFTGFQNLQELALKGYLLHIQKDVLEFTPVDILSYFRLCGVVVKEGDAQRLYGYTEGWVSALYLLMLGYKKEGTFPMPGDIFTLIEKTVFLPLSDEAKEFLVHISLFDSFTREQAAHMWQKGNVKELLEQTTGKNAFIRYDEKSRSYQVHKIFSEFLKSILDQQEPRENSLLYRRAASWYLKTGDCFTAMHYFYLAKDFEQLLLTLEMDRGHSMSSEHSKKLMAYFDGCPEEIRRKHPTALLIYALCLFTYNEAERFSGACEELQRLLGDGSMEPETARELAGELEVLLSFSEYNNIESMLGHYKKAGALMQSPAKFMDTRESWTFGSPSVLYMFHRQSGELENEVGMLREALPYYSAVTNGHGRGAEYVMEAEMQYVRGDFTSAEIAAHKALYQASAGRQQDILLCAVFLQVKIALYKGDYAYVMYSLQKLRRDMERESDFNLLHTLDLCETLVQTSLQQKQGISPWILEGDFQSSRMYFPSMAFFNIVYGRVLLIRGEYHKLLGSIDHFIEIASVFPNTLGQICTRIYAAAANEKLFRRGAALSELHQALDAAQPDGILMPFVENGDGIRPLLEELARVGEYREFITAVFDLYVPYRQAVQRITAEYFAVKKPELTKREAEIAQLVALGFSNNEIGSKLYISENTVKTMLKRIFEKLQINSRAMLRQYVESQE